MTHISRKLSLTYIRQLSDARLAAALHLVENGGHAARDSDLAEAIRGEQAARREQAMVAAYVSEGLGE
jgi:hypothetical protein